MCYVCYRAMCGDVCGGRGISSRVACGAACRPVVSVSAVDAVSPPLCRASLVHRVSLHVYIKCGRIWGMRYTPHHICIACHMHAVPLANTNIYAYTLYVYAYIYIYIYN